MEAETHGDLTIEKELLFFLFSPDPTVFAVKNPWSTLKNEEFSTIDLSSTLLQPPIH